MYKKILVPLDGSELSKSIIEHVIRIAVGCSVPEVTLLRVREPMDKQGQETLSADVAIKLDEVYREEMLSYLAGVAEELKQAGVNAITVVVAGNPADEILKYAEDNGVGLIMMSTHGRTGILRWAFGSVADKVVRNSVVPTLLGPVPGSRGNKEVYPVAPQ